MGSKIYVGGLPYSATEQQLSDLSWRAWGSGFCADHYGQAHGTIPGTWIRGDVLGLRGTSSDFALNGSDMGGRTFTVNEARPQEPRAGGGGGGGRGGFGGGGGRGAGGKRDRW